MNKRRRWKAKARRAEVAAAVRYWMRPATNPYWRPVFVGSGRPVPTIGHEDAAKASVFGWDSVRGWTWDGRPVWPDGTPRHA